MSIDVLQETATSYDGEDQFATGLGDENEYEEYAEDEDDNKVEKLMLERWVNLWGNEEVRKKVITSGKKDTKPEHGFLCTVNMIGCLQNGTIFDEHEPRVIQLGEAEVVMGIDIALVSMDIGEKAVVEICPSLGYGSLGRTLDIPSNEILVYILELINAVPEPDLATYTADELLTIGIRKRERGNWWYARSELDIALCCYQRALEYLGNPGKFTPGSKCEVDKLLDDRLKVYNNIAATYIKEKNYHTALEALDYVVKCQPNNVKALFRKGTTLAALGDFSNALELLTRASKLDPDNNAIKTEVMAITNILKKQERKESKKLYKKMIGIQNETGKVEAPPVPTPPVLEKIEPKLSVKNLKQNTKSNKNWTLITVGTIGVVIVGLLAFRYREKIL